LVYPRRALGRPVGAATLAASRIILLAVRH
jgi:hypothetical protein